MAKPRAVTTRCPRRGRPLVWSATPSPSGDALDLTGYSCYCVLTAAEWDDLTDLFACRYTRGSSQSAGRPPVRSSVSITSRRRWRSPRCSALRQRRSRSARYSANAARRSPNRAS